MELAAQAAFLGRKAHTVGHGLSDICKNIRVKPKSLGQCECENAPALPRTLKSRPTVYPSPSERLPVLKLRNRCRQAVADYAAVPGSASHLLSHFLCTRSTPSTKRTIPRSRSGSKGTLFESIS